MTIKLSFDGQPPIQARDTISVHVMVKKPIEGIRFPIKNRSTLFSEKSGRSKQGYDFRSTFFKFFLEKNVQEPIAMYLSRDTISEPLGS